MNGFQACCISLDGACACLLLPFYYVNTQPSNTGAEDTAASVGQPKNPESKVLFFGFGDNTLVFHLLFWIRRTKIIDRKRILSNLRFMVNYVFISVSVVIAFPQRDVHIDSLSPIKVQIEKEDALCIKEKNS